MLGSAGPSFADLGAVVHGTTLVTNAIIERNGCPPGLLTTCGFRDIFEIGTEQLRHLRPVPAVAVLVAVRR